MKKNIEYSPASDAPNATVTKLRHQSPIGWFQESVASVWRRRTTFITFFSVASILLYLLLQFGLGQGSEISQIPLLATFVFGGIPLVYELLVKLWKREFGSDLLAGISIVSSLLLGEYLAGAIVVLMLAGGEALENYALRSASSVLAALAKRMPSVAHRNAMWKLPTSH